MDGPLKGAQTVAPRLSRLKSESQTACLLWLSFLAFHFHFLLQLSDEITLNSLPHFEFLLQLTTAHITIAGSV